MCQLPFDVAEMTSKFDSRIWDALTDLYASHTIYIFILFLSSFFLYQTEGSHLSLQNKRVRHNKPGPNDALPHVKTVGTSAAYTVIRPQATWNNYCDKTTFVSKRKPKKARLILTEAWKH